MREQMIRETGARVVVRAYQGGGDVWNAFVVFAQVVGPTTAVAEIRHEASRLGEDANAVIEALELPTAYH